MVDYNDRRFQDVNAEKQTALNNVNNMYNNMISNSDKYYNDQIQAVEDYGNKQQELQQEQTDFALEKIDQQKDYLKKDYIKEQKGAYADWQKQSNQYGVNAEAMASQGLNNTGYAESSQVSMYNTYQNRISTARETYTRAVTDYDNAYKDAILQNKSSLLELAYNTLEKKLSLSLQGFQYKNTLLQTQLQAQNDVEDRYYNRWKDVLNQINTENALAEQQRQFNAQMSLQRQSMRSSGGGSSSSGGGYEISGEKGQTAEKTYKSTYSPTLSSSKAQKWYVKSALNTTKGLTESQIANTINSAYQSKTISKKDVASLLKAYGLQ